MTFYFESNLLPKNVVEIYNFPKVYETSQHEFDQTNLTIPVVFVNCDDHFSL